MTTMQIRVGFEMEYQCRDPTPMILALSIHYSRASDLVRPDLLVTSPAVPVTAYRDLFGNWCSRLVAPPGRFVLSTDALVNDSGLPDVVAPQATQTPVEHLPESTLVYLLGSRYCETDQLSDIAWQHFGAGPTGWARVQAICDFVHRHIEFGYPHARNTRTALEAYREGRGVCRDYAHLAIALCRCMNIPGPLLHRLSRRHGHRAAVRADGLRRLVRGLAGRPLVHLRRAQQHAAHRPRAHRPRPRRLRRRAVQHLRAEHDDAVQGLDRRGRGGVMRRLFSACDARRSRRSAA
jgi:transglutaminase-like putative cysteine protease